MVGGLEQASTKVAPHPNASSLLRAGTGAAERIFSRSVRISFVESEDHPEPDGVDGSLTQGPLSLSYSTLKCADVMAIYTPHVGVLI